MQRQVSGEVGQKLSLYQIDFSKKLKDGGKKWADESLCHGDKA